METNNIYRDCSALPIYNFFQVIMEKDFNWLKINKDEDIEEEILAGIFSEILCEYNELTKNSKLIKNYKSKIDLEYLEAKYNMSKEIISLYLEYNEIEILLTIKNFGFQIDVAENIMPQIKRINKSLIGLKNRIKIQKSQTRKTKTLEHPPNFDLEKQVIYLESAIPLSYKIDIYNDSIKRYVYWNEILESKQN